MNRSQAHHLKHMIEDLLDGNELGLLRTEESPNIPDHWGVTIKLTDPGDWITLAHAARKPHDPTADSTELIATAHWLASACELRQRHLLYTNQNEPASHYETLAAIARTLTHRLHALPDIEEDD